MAKFKPSRADLLAARDKTLADLIAPNLRVLFCGINPGLYTAAIGHHFGRPGNRFWPALYASGFTPRLFDPSEERELLPLGFGITNLVARATATADEVTDDEFRAGGKVLMKKLKKYTPRMVAFVGVQAYRIAFNRQKAKPGRQPEPIGETPAWVLPSPSGLNAHYQPTHLAELFAELREAIEI
jgi:TDG/mug DNA glycosylase family protein